MLFIFCDLQKNGLTLICVVFAIVHLCTYTKLGEEKQGYLPKMDPKRMPQAQWKYM